MSGDRTKLVEAGRRKEWTQGIVNPPVWRASTMLFDTVEDLREANRRPNDGLYYGRRGTPTQWALAEALTEIEPGAAGTMLYPSGVAAITTALLAILKPGDDLLMVDSAYEPTRIFCDGLLKAIGVTTRYYAPTATPEEVAALFTETTRALFLESPGSLTFEVQDVPGLAAVARARGIVTLIDNTWATPLLLPSLSMGVDVSIIACTKYVSGHSDVMLGSATCAASVFEKVRRMTHQLGHCISADDAYLALRGLRTMGVRLQQHGVAGLEIAKWLEGRPEVSRVLHPALPGCPGHDLFVRDFKGASGLFTIELKTTEDAARVRFVDALKYFGIGFSWGGYESLALPIDPHRTAAPWAGTGKLVRLHIGLEDPADLIADLEQAFGAL